MTNTRNASQMNNLHYELNNHPHYELKNNKSAGETI